MLLVASLLWSSLTTSLMPKTVINQKLVNLTNAMVGFEGWHPGGVSGGQAGVASVSYRNHNPGNLRFSIFELGKRDGFSYFYNDSTGMFAMRFDIMRKSQGKTVTRLNGESTLKDLIEVYAAAKGQTLTNYLAYIEEMTGFKPEMKLKELVK